MYAEISIKIRYGMMQKQNVIFIAVMTVTFLACGSLWLANGFSVAHISSGDGTRDLRGANFDTNCFDLYGPVEYIPNAFLTPEEFAAHENEIQTVLQTDTSDYGTGRLRIYVQNGTYGLMMWNAEYASDIYVNGQMVERVGVPGDSASAAVPGFRWLLIYAEAHDGVIEIVQQASNFVTERTSGSYTDIIIGNRETVRDIYHRQNAVSAILMGSFFALALICVMLYAFLRSDRAALWFALFCLLWFVYTGCSEPWVLSSFLPLQYILIRRLMFCAIPAVITLLCLTMDTIFCGILGRRFCLSLYIVSGAYACFCLFAGMKPQQTVFLYFYFSRPFRCRLYHSQAVYESTKPHR
jgi:hypothetical protein